MAWVIAVWKNCGMEDEKGAGQHNQRAAQHEEKAAQHAEQAAHHEIAAATAASHLASMSGRRSGR